MSDQDKALIKFGLRVRRMRERNHMSQRELAEDSGISQSVISRIEAGKHELTIQNIYNLQEGFECQLLTLLKDFK